ncbi:hypothetical protein REPUB_Repub01dG0080500 [Reevesia pubescens]
MGLIRGLKIQTLMPRIKTLDFYHSEVGEEVALVTPSVWQQLRLHLLLLFHFDWSLPQGVGTDDVDLNEIFGLAPRKRTPLVLVSTVNKGLWF